MTISFASLEIREICENEFIAKTNLGENAAEMLFAILSDITSANSIFEIPGRNPEIHGKLGEFYKLHLGDKSLIILTSGHSKPIYLDNGKYDWNSVTRIKITEIIKK